MQRLLKVCFMVFVILILAGTVYSEWRKLKYGSDSFISSISIHQETTSKKPILYNFSEELPNASAYVSYGDDQVDTATWESSAWRFKQDNSWNPIRVQKESFNGIKHRCIWFHPLENANKTLEYNNVPVGETIEIFGGIVNPEAKSSREEAVNLRVRLDGQVIKGFQYRDSDRPAHRSIELQPDNKLHKVSFEVTTAKQARRHFCFDAVMK